jgi:hypothetical protein
MWPDMFVPQPNRRNNMTNPAHSRFYALHDLLIMHHPEAIAEAKKLAASTVDAQSANAEAIWGLLWDKPLYANARVSVATRWVESVRADMQGAWQFMGADPAVFRILHKKPGIKRDSFEVQGALAQDLVAKQRIALHRLHRIQGAAIALRARAAHRELPFDDLVGKPLRDNIATLQREFGTGWGVITVLHALTDMGLAVKPDLHLVNTMSALELTTGLSRQKVPDINDSIRINEDVRTLLRATGRAETPFELRYTDKVLMEISRLGLLSKNISTTAETSARTGASAPPSLR